MSRRDKIGRNKRRNERKGSPIALFVKGKITAHKYWELTGQSISKIRTV